MIGLLLEKARLFYRDVGYSTDEVGYYGFTNQFGHMMLGYFLVWAVGHYTGLGFWASLVIVAAVYTAWEAVQDMPSNYRALGDIATDWAFVVGGGLMLLLPGLWGIFAATLIAGAFGIITQPVGNSLPTETID